jgi:membrane protein YdbS with pleckstrin-like domain
VPARHDWPSPSARVTERLRPDETLVAATRRHWLVPGVDVAGVLGAILLLVLVDAQMGSGGEPLVRIGWILVLGLAARAFWRWLEWRVTWFVVTDERLLLSYGVLVRNLAMMPLGKVTDMRYVRTPLGQHLGWGEFVFESAGQEQAMRDVDLLPRSDDLYDVIYEEIAKREKRARMRAGLSRRSSGPRETEIVDTGSFAQGRGSEPGPRGRPGDDRPDDQQDDGDTHEHSSTHRSMSRAALWRAMTGGDGERR